VTAHQLALPLPPPTPYTCTPRDLAELDYYVFGIGPPPDDIPPRDVLADARAVAERHRASVRALWGGR
jgi:hypothetical protein